MNPNLGRAALVGCIGLGFALGGCNEPTASDTFKALRNCSANAIQASDSIIYFGPTNSPIGTIYERETSGYDLDFRGTEVTGDPPSKSMVEPPAFQKCTVAGSSSLDFSVAFGLTVNPIPVSGSLSNDLRHATVTKVTADQVGWQSLYKGPYQAALKANTAVYPAIVDKDVYVTVSMLRVKGYTASLEFKSGDTGALKAKYSNGPLPASLKGDVNGEVQLKWNSDNTLSLTIVDDTAIGGVMRAIKKGTLASGSSSTSAFGESVGPDGLKVTLK